MGVAKTQSAWTVTVVRFPIEQPLDTGLQQAAHEGLTLCPGRADNPAPRLARNIDIARLRRRPGDNEAPVGDGLPAGAAVDQVRELAARRLADQVRRGVALRQRQREDQGLELEVAIGPRQVALLLEQPQQGVGRGEGG